MYKYAVLAAMAVYAMAQNGEDPAPVTAEESTEPTNESEMEPEEHNKTEFVQLTTEIDNGYMLFEKQTWFSA